MQSKIQLGAEKVSQEERDAFSNRLQHALKMAGFVKFQSPTAVATEFNERYEGKPLTVHAVRKWLTAETIPTQAKVIELANWLGVTPEWLRFGIGQRYPAHRDGIKEELVVEIAKDFKRLHKDRQAMVRQFIAILLEED